MPISIPTPTPIDIHPIAGGALHPDVVDRLDPEYIKLYESYLLGKPQVQERKPSYFKSSKGSYLPGHSAPIDVGKEEVFSIPRTYTCPGEEQFDMRIYTPKGAVPEGGWPIFYSIHGGGWVLGSDTSEEGIQTRFCEISQCIVASPAYRLSPDWSYPSCVEDCWEGLLWLWENGSSLGANVERFAIGGASAGGHLAAVMVNMLHVEPHAPAGLKFCLNLMSVPVVDNTAGEPHLGSPTWDAYPSWTENAFAPALPASKMLWYRNLFCPNPEYRADWHCSPILCPEEMWAKHPPTFVGVCEVDVLRDEGLAFAAKLKQHGIPVQVEVYKGMPHPAVAQAEALKEGKRFQMDLVEALRVAFWGK